MLIIIITILALPAATAAGQNSDYIVDSDDGPVSGARRAGKRE